MRLLGSSGSCCLLLASNLGGVHATASDNKFKYENPVKSDNERTRLWARLFAQKKLSTECPLDHQLCPDSVGGGCCPKAGVRLSDGCSALLATTVTVVQPKMTEPPLFRRKIGSNKWDMVHEGMQGRKRDTPQCGSGFQSCAASLNGGCCPNDRVCRTDSCYAASTLPATVCGVAGFVACGIAEGGILRL